MMENCLRWDCVKLDKRVEIVSADGKQWLPLKALQIPSPEVVGWCIFFSSNCTSEKLGLILDTASSMTLLRKSVLFLYSKPSHGPLHPMVPRPPSSIWVSCAGLTELTHDTRTLPHAACLVFTVLSRWKSLGMCLPWSFHLFFFFF